MIITLPYPPSLNSYYRMVNNRWLISKKGREYRKQVALEALSQQTPKMGAARLEVAIVAYMPDKRKRDLDNLFKAVCDALQKAGIYDDDSQIDKLSIIRDGQCKGGKLIIQIKDISNVYDKAEQRIQNDVGETISLKEMKSKFKYPY